MANDSYTQQGLGLSLNFRARVQNAMSTVAFQVLNEAANVPNHAIRVAYARTVIANIGAAAQTATPWLSTRPNLMAAVTSYDFKSAAVVTDATDAAIESQLFTDWNVLAGV